MGFTSVDIGESEQTELVSSNDSVMVGNMTVSTSVDNTKISLKTTLN